ncbi:MAG: LEA type 2 family protein [Pseudomonadota bacterium]|nr:LEA type 2 family protein [Pseudomonadota bacterium]
MAATSDPHSGQPRRLAKPAFLGITLSALVACASFGPRLAAPTVTVEGISVGRVQGADAIVTLSLRVENQNETELALQSLRFGLSINDVALSSGTTLRSETIAAGGSAVIELETHTNMASVLQIVALAATGRASSLRYALEGEALVQNGIRLAFARRGDIPLPVSLPPPPRQ